MVNTKQKAILAVKLLSELGKKPKSKNINDICNQVEKLGYIWDHDASLWVKKNTQYITVNVKADSTVVNEMMECIVDAISKLEVAELKLLNIPKPRQAKDTNKEDIEGMYSFYLMYKNNTLGEELDLEDLDIDIDD